MERFLLGQPGVSVRDCLVQPVSVARKWESQPTRPEVTVGHAYQLGLEGPQEVLLVGNQAAVRAVVAPFVPAERPGPWGSMVLPVEGRVLTQLVGSRGATVARRPMG